MAKTFEFDAYHIMLVDPDYADYKPADFAKLLEVPVETVYKWNKQTDWEDIKDQRRKTFARATIEVDQSLLKATRKLDVQAIRTWYERFDNFTPASKVTIDQSLSEKDLNEAIQSEIEKVGSREVEKADAGVDALLPAEPGPTEIH